MRGKSIITCLTILIVCGISITYDAFNNMVFADEMTEKDIKVSNEGRACIGCHETISPAFIREWKTSKHARTGIDCYACHQADKSEPDAMQHNGFTVSMLVTPKDCSKCHPREVDEFSRSHHAQAGDILSSLDNYLGEIAGGPERWSLCLWCISSSDC